MSTGQPRPLIVVEGPDEQFRHALREVAAAGWRLLDGWARPPGVIAVVCAGLVTGPDDAAAAVAAVVAGAGAVIHGQGPRRVLDALCDDLRHLGALDHRVGDARVVLDDEERRLLDALAGGSSVATAARRLYLSRRTVERRLTRLKERFGVDSSVELLAAYRAQNAAVPKAP